MSRHKRNELRRSVIKELYGLNLVEALYLNEQAAPEEDPTAADPAAAPADPAAAAAPVPADPTVAPTVATPPPADSALAAPPPDPTMMGGMPADPTAMGTPPAPPAQQKDPVAAAEDQRKINPDQLADPIERFLVNAEQRSIKKQGPAAAVESLSRKSLGFLLEAESTTPRLDMEVFAAEIARLIKNYTDLVDVKGSVIQRAQNYIREKYPKEGIAYNEELLNLLKRHYGISLSRSENPPDAYAVGAVPGGAAAS